MASNNTEIEIKIPVTTRKFQTVKKRLERIAELRTESYQLDEYYNPSFKDFFALDHPIEYLRIRKKSNGGNVNYKHWHTDENGETTHCDEFETNVVDTNQIEKIFGALGIKRYISIEKTRLTYVVKDLYEVCLDTVEGLGNFVEIESLKHGGSVVKTRKDLFSFAKKLGLNPAERDKDGYVLLMLKKRKLLKKQS